jgi:hypothetical protein
MAADSGNLVGIHFWGDRNDATPSVMLDSVGRGAWDLEIVNTANLQFGGWKDEDVVDPLYQKFKTDYNVTPITRLGYYWGRTLPAPGTPEYAGWASYIASNVVGRMKNTAHLWQMGNEPNLHGEATNWVDQKITPGAYAALYQEVRNAIRTPGLQGTAGAHKLLVAPVSPGGVAGDRWMDGSQWLDQALAAIPAAEVDGVAIHAYGGGATAWQSMVDFHKAVVQQLRVIDGRGLSHVPVYLTEWNRISSLGDANQEGITADFARKAMKFIDRWNRTPGNHNIVGTNWFVYDGTNNGTGGWDGYSIEYWKANGNPQGHPGDLYMAFHDIARAGYRSGVEGTRPIPSSVRFIDDFEAATPARFSSVSVTSSGMSGFITRQDEDSYTKGFSTKFVATDNAAAGGWYARLPTTTAATPATNTAIPLTEGQDGFVGFFLRVYTVNGVQATDMATPATTMQVAISMDVAADNSRTEQGVWRPIIADGEWHFYEWNLDGLADWTQWRNGAGAVIGNSTGAFPTIGNVWLDSILIRGGDHNAEFMFDSIMVNSAGSLAAMDYVPEPGGLAVLGIGGIALLRRSRR